MKIYNYSKKKFNEKEYDETDLTVFIGNSGDFDREHQSLSFSKINILISEDHEAISSYFMIVYKDIPSKKELNTDLKRLKEKLEVQNLEYIKALVTGFLLESILHEFNNPITSISLNSQFLMEVIEMDEHIDRDNALKILNMMNNSILEASDIGKSLVTFSRMEHEDIELFNLKDDLRTPINFLTPYLRKRGIDLYPKLTDSAILANKADLSLFMMLLLISIGNSNEEKMNLNVLNTKDTILLQVPNLKINSIIGLANHSLMLKCDFISTFSTIVNKNKFVIIFERDEIQIYFQNKVTGN